MNVSVARVTTRELGLPVQRVATLTRSVSRRTCAATPNGHEQRSHGHKPQRSDRRGEQAPCSDAA